ncbi:glycosyltransferase [Streptomyces mayonensis]|uniref:glycosyltransferase n=1 Tax=Streptomyces mayonensis TaxID=2750816 RepID=UPI0027E4538C|nr:glycosyltransferase [Streptomyces sp. A108]
MRPPATPRERSAPEPASGKYDPDAPQADEAPAHDSRTREAPTAHTSRDVTTERTSRDVPTAHTSRDVPTERTSRDEPAAHTSQDEPTERTLREESTTRTSQESAAESPEEVSARPEPGGAERVDRPATPEPPGSGSGSGAEPPVSDPSDLAPATRPARAAAAWPAVPLLTALALWVYAVRHTDVSALDDYGLVGALHPAFWAGLAVLTAGFWFTVRDPRRRSRWPLAHVLGLLVMERATQALLYPTPLYAWAWKHDAVVDHLLTSGGLQGADRLGDMAVYDQWPGFFAAQAALVRLLGVDNTAMYMAWWPLVSSVLLLLPLLLIYRTFTTDRRLIWTAVWLFCVANWVGQDYFSPQSVAFALHLGVLAIVLRRYGRTGVPGTAGTAGTSGTAGDGADGRGVRQGQAVWTVLLSMLVVAVVVSHQLTPGMLVVTLLALALTRRHRDWIPLITTVVIFLAWCLTAALPFLSAAMPDMIRSVGDVGANVETGYGTTPTGTGAVAMSWAARLLSGSVLLLALAGVLRRRVLRHRAFPLLLLAAAPLPMFVASSYGSEMIFRVLMFMLPGAAFFAAAALLPTVRASAAEVSGPANATARAIKRPSAPARRRRLSLPAPPPLRYGAWLAPLVLLAGTLAFVPSYSGKDRINYFPPREVALVQRLFDQAPDDSLVVAANRNYPLAYEQYWRVDHYWFLDDDRRHVDEIVRDPAGVLARDMAAVDPPARAYFLLTQGQVANSEMNGQLNEAQLRRVRESVAGSPRFERVAENGAGVLYVLKPAS